MLRNSLSRVSLAGIVSMLAAPMAAQTASYTYLSQKVPYKNPGATHWPSPGPWLTALNLPKIGTTFRIQIPNGYRPWWSGYHAYTLAMGVRNPDVRFDLLGGFLYTSAEFLTMSPLKQSLPVGNHTVSIPIPNSTQLLGTRFYQQVLHMWDPYNYTLPTLELSRGGVGTIGR